MKIPYEHLVKHVKENPSISDLSNSLFQLGHEHEIDNGIFDMEFTPNRGDCLSINGLLRDLGAFYTINNNHEIYNEKLNELSLNFKNLSKNICPKISFLKLEIQEVPKLYNGDIESYFSDLGIKKTNFFADISNYLSYETGQPTHCYDANKIKGTLIFNEIEEDIEFETLVGKKISLQDKNSVFLLNNEVINLAGIMGGKTTACSSATKSVIVECAFFQPESIIGKSIKYDIQSDAAHKFERGVDSACQERVLRRFIKIVAEHTKIKNLSFISHNFVDISTHEIPLNVDKINKIIGINISNDDYKSNLTRLGFSIKGNNIEVPSYRNDVKTQNDLAEEVARVFGYDNIPVSEINIHKSPNKNDKNIENKIRFFLLDHGFYEVINSPFVFKENKKSIKVDNPLDSNRQYLRTNIKDSLLDNLLFNERRQKDSIKLFEIADIYTATKNSIQKTRKISIIGSGRVGKNFNDFSKSIDEAYIKSIFDLTIPANNINFEYISRDGLNSKIKSKIICAEIDVKDIPSDILNYSETSSAPENFIKYKVISELPSSYRDISYSIQDYSEIKQLQQLLSNYKNNILKEVFIFDYFKNEKRNEVKCGFRLVFQGTNSTLTDSQIDEVMDDIIEKSLQFNSVQIPGLSQ